MNGAFVWTATFNENCTHALKYMLSALEYCRQVNKMSMETIRAFGCILKANDARKNVHFQGMFCSEALKGLYFTMFTLTLS